MASARSEIPEVTLDKYGYIKVVATKIKGFPEEIVIVDKGGYNELNPEIKNSLFKSL